MRWYTLFILMNKRGTEIKTLESINGKASFYLHVSGLELILIWHHYLEGTTKSQRGVRGGGNRCWKRHQRSIHVLRSRWGFLGVSDSKESAHNAGWAWFDPWVRKIP